ncbi:MAG: hypothetical protein HGA45_40585 [Chloroflexales bacterium]|nr:hypothetical protein [Chloroflexales bacterium]
MEKASSAESAEPRAGHVAVLRRAVAAIRPTSTPRRHAAVTTYDRITRAIGLGVALVLMVALWLTGSFFTLQWLASVGVRVANAGLDIGNARRTVPAVLPVLSSCGLKPAPQGSLQLWMETRRRVAARRVGAGAAC